MRLLVRCLATLLAASSVLANPVSTDNVADPGVLAVGGDYYAVCTSGGAPRSFPIRRSTDLEHWSLAGYVFPEGQQPAWATGDYWAPEIHPVGERFNVYYTARNREGQLSIGVATGDSPTGPFTDLGRPLVAGERVGVIDPNYFQDQDGKRYLYWKVDGNDIGEPTPILVAELAPDGLSLAGKPSEVLRNTLPWEGPLVEAPWLDQHDGSYYLFYSANTYYDARYTVGVARSDSPLGPFVKLPEPILKSDERWSGPGHGSVVTDRNGQDWFVYHAWRKGEEPMSHRETSSHRMLLVDKIEWQPSGWPKINDGTPSD